MAWLIFDRTASLNQSGSSPWQLSPNDIITVPPRHEMALHGELVIDGLGEIRVENTARLILEF